ncbi:hypothetical protein Tco_0555545 [Tanacetum coccineum]
MSKEDETHRQELKQVEVNDQAIQTILIGLPEYIYDVVDIYETAQEIGSCVQQMMKGSDIGAQEKKSKLFNEWERFTSIDGESIESYYHRTDKSKITRKQSKASKHGHENQKSTKRSQRSKAEARKVKPQSNPTVAVSDDPEDGSRVHTHNHDGSEAPDESPDSIISSEPKPLRKHRPPPPPSILSPGESSYTP